MKKLKIGIDIDNVISDTYRAVLKEFNKKFATKVNYEEIDNFYYLEKSSGIDEKKARDFFYELHFSSFSLKFDPYADAVRVIDKWRRQGISLHYITARPSTGYEMTHAWLKKHNFLVPKATLDLYEQGQEISDEDYKKGRVEKRKINLMIEDSPEIARAMPIPVLLFDQPWNRVKLPSNVTRVHSWKEIEVLVSSRQFFGL